MKTATAAAGNASRTTIGFRRGALRRSVLYITVSWFLWGIGYYGYFAYLSPYMSSFVEPSRISLIYVIAGATSVVYPSAGLISYRLLGVRGSISLWMMVAGLGISMMGLARNFAQFALLLALNQAFYGALPSYYASLAKEEASYIPLVWALSVAPSFFMPTVGGLVASRLGFTVLFVTSGVLIASSVLPVVAIRELRADEGAAGVRGWALAIPAMIPVALESPYIFLVMERAYDMSSLQLGLVASAGEAVGMMSALALRRTRWGLSAALAGFSTTALLTISWAFGIAFGFWEAVIPLAIAYVSYGSGSPGVRFYAYLTTLQALTFLAGYLSSSVVASVNYMAVPMIGGALSAVLTAMYVFLTGRGRRPSSR
ncbi:MAG: hypothetical protein ACP5G6_01515 [Conexivisphaera sp.]